MAKERRVFVTGSTGCIGTHAVDLMIEEGAEVFGFNRSAPVNRLKNSHYHHLEGDLVDRETLRTALKEVRPTHILHLGALQTPDCRDYPMRGMQVNLMGTAYLFEACIDLQLPLERFVFASSSAVNGPRSLYGPEGVRPEDPLQPFNLYGYWKIAGEGMAQAFQQASEVSTVSLRLATTYGPGRDRGFTAAMTSAIKSVVNHEPYEIPYRGKENYHFSSDVGAGFARATLDPFSGYGVYNLLGETRSVDEFIALLGQEAEKFDLSADLISFAEDAEETPFIYDLNDDATRSAFPAMPKTSLTLGIRKSIEFFRDEP